MIVNVKILTPLSGVFAEYQPEVGEIYEASYTPPKWPSKGKQISSPVCIIKMNDKNICLRQNEYEIVGD